MEEKQIRGRFQQKTDTSQNWEKAGNNGFIPKKGEIIVYQDDTSSKIKIGDGVTNVNILEFSSGEADLSFVEEHIINKENPHEVTAEQIDAVSLNKFNEHKNNKNNPHGITATQVIGAAGHKTEYNGEVFNDDNNKALSPYSAASGKETTAGILGYYYYNVDINNKKIYVTDQQGVANTSTVVNYSVGDVLSIVHGSKYPNCSTITTIDGNVITVDSLPMTSFSLSTSSDDACSLYAISKPLAGVVSLGYYAHAEGLNTQALERVAHAEGRDTLAYGQYGHAEGRGTKAFYCAHSEGYYAEATGFYSHAEGGTTKATAQSAHAEGENSVATAERAHAEGYKTKAVGKNTHAEGEEVEAGGQSSHAEGYKTIANGKYSHTEGNISKTEGIGSHAEGYNTFAQGEYSHSEGRETKALGNYSHTEGTASQASGECSHAEGKYTQASGMNAHAEGYGTYATQPNAHAEGQDSQAKAKGAHAEGYKNFASGEYSHAEGSNTNAVGNSSHAEGINTYAYGLGSHSEGFGTNSNHQYSHSEGMGTSAYGEAQHVQGKYNIINSSMAHILGNGSPKSFNENGEEVLDSNGKSIPKRSNAHTVDWNGNAWYAGNLKIGGTKYEDANAKVVATEDYVDEAIAKIPISDEGIKFKVVSELPTEEIDESTIYLVPTENPSEQNTYDEYIYTNGAWECIGSASVEVNLDEYVKKTDIARHDKAGVIRIDSSGTHGLGLTSDGNIFLHQTTQKEIDSRKDYKAITANRLDYAVKTGLTTNTEEWTEEEKAAARTLLNAIGKEEYATADNAGVIKVVTQNGLDISGSGKVYIVMASNAEINAKTSEYKPITPRNLDYSVMKALTEPQKHTWTEEEKASARDLIGAVEKPANPPRTSVLSMQGDGTILTAQLVHESAAPWSVVARDGSGGVVVANPTLPEHATSKQYVDDAIENAGGGGSGGDATADYIVEQGTEGNFTYRKWNSGVAEMWAHISVTHDEIEALSVTEDGIFRCSYRIISLPFQFKREEYCGVIQPITISGSAVESGGNIVVPCSGFMECPWSENNAGEPVSNEAIKLHFDLPGYDRDGDGTMMWAEQNYEDFTLCIHIIDRWK